ncbi:ComEC/Rec2 family competence protein [Mangrovimonas sp. TPBH4]|uniref:ComEC/Rec2 family competence protein n=1 Tax=Mangrovimonas sp. TPBH4 TaxID=1645914 RepID=UPI0006B505A5|nr:ComEC/Rec2 family competence protein [Mangrovimonas sp. TPBH4]
MKLLRFPIIKLTVCLILGIVASYYYNIPFNLAATATLGGLLLLFTLHRVSKHKLEHPTSFGIAALCTTFFLGVSTFHFHNQRNFKNHYSNIILKDKATPSRLVLRVREQLKPSTYHEKYVVDLLKIDSIPVRGKTLLNIEIDSLYKPFKIDEIISVKSLLNDLNPPLNPNQFNYKAYLEKQYIHHQISTNRKEILSLSAQPHTIFGYAALIRQHILNRLENTQLSKEDSAILSALLLGQRQNISPETYEQFTKAGAVHILAISGLHVGIILLLLNLILRPIERFRLGKLYKTIITIVLLWIFALISGLSPSVTRAVTMFCVVSIGMNLKRPANIYNTLAISIFILLLFKPMLLFDVGFQLSYLAVIAIVTIQPLLNQLYSPKTKIDKLFWNVLTVTIAAQFGVLPLSIYYFHQAPLLFFVSNLLVIPILGLLLGCGILVVFLSLVNLPIGFVTDVFHHLSNYMQSVVAWTAAKEAYIIKDIAISSFMVVAFYLLIITSVRYWRKRDFNRLAWMLLAIISLQIAFIFNKHSTSRDAFIVFHKSRHSILSIHKNEQLEVNHNLDRFKFSKDKMLQNYRVENFISSMEQGPLKDLYMINNKSLLVIDSLGVYNVSKFKPYYLLLRNSPKINLKRVIDSIHPQSIIADGSNYRSYIEAWKTTCKKEKLPFHQTSEKGAFIITN